MQTASSKIGYVNGLRGIAIVMVVWHHLYGQHFELPEVAEQLGWLVPIYSFAVSGWLGVNVFFVLSGFVLFLPFAGQNGPLHARRFLVRRGWRILPLYYVNIAVCLGLMFAFEPLARVAQHMAVYLIAAFPSPVLFFPPFNPPLWSLGIEIWFSITFPVLVLLFRRFGFLRVFSVTLLSSLTVHFVGMLLVREYGSFLNPISDTLPGRLSDFLIGMFAAFMWKTGKVSGPWGSVLALAGVLLVVVAVLGSERWFRGAFPSWTQTFWNLSLACGVAAVIVGLRDFAPRSVFRAALELWPLQIVGLMCFSLYIWHWQLIELFTFFWGSDDWIARPYRVAAYLVGLLFLGALSYRFIEFPLQRDVRALFGMRQVNYSQAPPPNTHE
jgi:peptidoglycan/LPS O-acetylase OafA/YrhL